MKVQHKLLEITEELKNEEEAKRFIRGLCDELYLHKLLLQYYMTATIMNTQPNIFQGLRLAVEGAYTEWCLHGGDWESIWERKQKQYEKLLKRVGMIKEQNTMEVA